MNIYYRKYHSDMRSFLGQLPIIKCYDTNLQEVFLNTTRSIFEYNSSVHLKTAFTKEKKFQK